MLEITTVSLIATLTRLVKPDCLESSYSQMRGLTLRSSAKCLSELQTLKLTRSTTLTFSLRLMEPSTLKTVPRLLGISFDPASCPQLTRGMSLYTQLINCASVAELSQLLMNINETTALPFLLSTMISQVNGKISQYYQTSSPKFMTDWMGWLALGSRVQVGTSCSMDFDRGRIMNKFGKTVSPHGMGDLDLAQFALLSCSCVEGSDVYNKLNVLTSVREVDSKGKEIDSLTGVSPLASCFLESIYPFFAQFVNKLKQARTTGITTLINWLRNGSDNSSRTCDTVQRLGLTETAIWRLASSAQECSPTVLQNKMNQPAQDQGQEESLPRALKWNVIISEKVKPNLLFALTAELMEENDISYLSRKNPSNNQQTKIPWDEQTWIYEK